MLYAACLKKATIPVGDILVTLQTTICLLEGENWWPITPDDKYYSVKTNRSLFSLHEHADVLNKSYPTTAIETAPEKLFEILEDIGNDRKAS